MTDEVLLDQDARAVLDAGRDLHQPTELERARVRRAVELRLAAGAVALGHPRWVLPGSAKLVGAAAVAGAVAGGAWYAAEPRVVRRARPVLTTERVPASPANRVSRPASASAAPAAPAPPRATERAQRALGRSEQLAAEIALLAQVNSAINGGSTERAFALLRQYDQRFSPGVLGEERAAAGILALCAAGRVDAARTSAERFAKSWPRSPLLERINGSCAGSH